MARGAAASSNATSLWKISSSASARRSWSVDNLAWSSCAARADSWSRWKWQPVTPQEGQLVPVASLEHDLATDDVEEAAAPQTKRVTPFENGPFTFFEDVLHDAHHVGRCELGREHLSDSH